MNDKIQDDPMQWLLSELAEQAARDVSEPFDERDQLERTLLALFEAAMAAGADKQAVFMLTQQMMRLADIDIGVVPDVFKPVEVKSGRPTFFATGMHRKMISAAVAYVMARDKCCDEVASTTLAGRIKLKASTIRSEFNTTMFKSPSSNIGSYTIVDDAELDKLVEQINREL